MALLCLRLGSDVDPKPEATQGTKLLSSFWSWLCQIKAACFLLTAYHRELLHFLWPMQSYWSSVFKSCCFRPPCQWAMALQVACAEQCLSACGFTSCLSKTLVKNCCWNWVTIWHMTESKSESQFGACSHARTATQLQSKKEALMTYVGKCSWPGKVWMR